MENQSGKCARTSFGTIIGGTGMGPAIGSKTYKVWCPNRYYIDGYWVKEANLPAGYNKYMPEIHYQEVFNYWDADKAAKNLLTNDVDWCRVHITEECLHGRKIQIIPYCHY